MKVAVQGYHAGKAWLCICVGVEPPFSKSWIRHCCVLLSYSIRNYITIMLCTSVCYHKPVGQKGDPGVVGPQGPRGYTGKHTEIIYNHSCMHT